MDPLTPFAYYLRASCLFLAPNIWFFLEGSLALSETWVYCWTGQAQQDLVRHVLMEFPVPFSLK